MKWVKTDNVLCLFERKAKKCTTNLTWRIQFNNLYLVWHSNTISLYSCQSSSSFYRLYGIFWTFLVTSGGVAMKPFPCSHTHTHKHHLSVAVAWLVPCFRHRKFDANVLNRFDRNHKDDDIWMPSPIDCLKKIIIASNISDTRWIVAGWLIVCHLPLPPIERTINCYK